MKAFEDQEAFQSTWWPVVLIFVKNLAAWNTIAAARNIAAVDACQANGGCFPEVVTNAFLFFQVLGPGMSPLGPHVTSHQSRAGRRFMDAALQQCLRVLQIARQP